MATTIWTLNHHSILLIVELRGTDTFAVNASDRLWGFGRYTVTAMPANKNTTLLLVKTLSDFRSTTLHAFR
ncbi:MAG TPA: hypothetical protein VGF61_10430, partial [Candidatus Acidoferrum sp.]